LKEKGHGAIIKSPEIASKHFTVLFPKKKPGMLNWTTIQYSLPGFIFLQLKLNKLFGDAQFPIAH